MALPMTPPATGVGALAEPELVVPGELLLMPGRRTLTAVHFEADATVATVALPSLVERWQRPLLFGVLVSAVTAGLWLPGYIIAAALWLPLLMTLIVARAVQLFGLFAPAIRVLRADGDDCVLELRPIPDWRIVVFRYSVVDAGGRRLGTVANVLGNWVATDDHRQVRFTADDQELRCSRWGHRRRGELRITDAAGGVVAVAESRAVSFGAAAAKLSRDDRKLLFVTAVIAELAIDNRL
jgi:hypothetical protein